MFLALLTKLGIPQWCAEMLAGALIIVVLAGGGYYKGHHDAEQADQVAMQQAQLAHDAEVARMNAIGQQIEEKFEALQRQKDAAVQTIIQEVPRVTTVYRPAPGAADQPLPHCVFTAGFVSVWNSAFDPGVPAAAGGAAAAPAAADPAQDLDSGDTEADVLDNHVRNSGECSAQRDQLNSLIDFFESTKEAR